MCVCVEIPACFWCEQFQRTGRASGRPAQWAQGGRGGEDVLDLSRVVDTEVAKMGDGLLSGRSASGAGSLVMGAWTHEREADSDVGGWPGRPG